GLVEKIESHTLTLPYGDRSGVVIEPWPTDQWYVDAAELAKPAIAAVEDGRTRFVPEQWTATYFQWMRNIQPWCISRQLWWGHQIPAWWGPDKVFVAETEKEALEQARTYYDMPVEVVNRTDALAAWYTGDPSPSVTKIHRDEDV